MKKCCLILSLVMGFWTMIGHAGMNGALGAGGEFPYIHSMFDYQVCWKTEPAGDACAIDGILKNVRYQKINSVDLTLTVVGKDMTVRARQTVVPQPQVAAQNEPVPFRLYLPGVKLEQGDLLEVAIHYKVLDGGPDHGTDWTSTFRADAMNGQIVTTRY